MKLNTPEQQFHAKQRIQNLIETGHLGEAEKLLNTYEKAAPDDHDLYLLKGVFYILSGSNKEAIDTMKKGLFINPRHYNLLFNLGYLFEQQGEIMDAFNLYRQAEYNVQTPDQNKDLKERVKRVKDKIKSKTSIGEKGFLIQVKAGKKRFNIEYPLDELIIRKNILNTILKHLDPKAETMLEIECGPGIISHILSEVGLETTAIDGNNNEIIRAILFEMQGRVRLKEEIAITQFYNISAAKGHLQYLPAYDVMILVPSSFHWYMQHQVEVTQKIISAISQKAAKQMFIYLPEAEEKHKQVRDHLKSGFHNADAGDGAVIQNIDSKDSFPGDLYMLDKTEETHSISRIIPFGLESIQSKSSILEVELDKCRDIQYFSYSSHGWHPFTATIKENLQNPEITYSESILKRFYDTFQPKNRQEQWLEEEVEEIKPLSQGWPIRPWDIGHKRIPKQYMTERIKERKGNQHFGPNSLAFGEDQYKRLINTYKMIQMNGFHPEIFPDGYLNGVLLVKDDDYRFLLIEGQHRIPALSLMGVKNLYCQFNPQKQYPRIVNYDEIESWAQVSNGLYTKEVAEKIFIKYFYENGNEKARRLGMIP